MLHPYLPPKTLDAPLFYCNRQLVFVLDQKEGVLIPQKLGDKIVRKCCTQSAQYMI